MDVLFFFTQEGKVNAVTKITKRKIIGILKKFSSQTSEIGETM